MRAPVYRHLEARQALAGISIQGFLALLGVALGAIQFLPFLPSLLAVAVAYASLRLAGHGRPPQYWQHRAVFELRQRRHDGRLSAAARCQTPQFPFGVYQPKLPAAVPARSGSSSRRIPEHRHG